MNPHQWTKNPNGTGDTLLCVQCGNMAAQGGVVELACRGDVSRVKFGWVDTATLVTQQAQPGPPAAQAKLVKGP